MGRWRQGLHFPDFSREQKGPRPTGHRWVRSWPRGLATDISSVFTSGPEYDNSNNTHRFPPPAAAPQSICHKPNNSALRPQARNNTCWRDQQLANAFNKPGPRVLFYPENHPKVLVNTSSANPTQIHLTWPCPFFSPSMHFPFYSVAFYLSIALPPSLSGHFSFLPFLYSFAFSRPLCGCGRLRPAYEVWDKFHVSIGDNVRTWIHPSCVKSESGGCAHIHATLVSIPGDLREYWLAITQTATPHWRITPGRQHRPHRSVSPPTRADMKPFNWSQPDLLFSQRKLQIHLFLSPFFPPFLTIYPDRGRLVHAERHISHCCRDNQAQIFEMPLFWAGRGARAVNSHVASVVLRL